ncbi:acetate--CoA ligase family protein, partial [[Eubacterium] cellulosolvens]
EIGFPIVLKIVSPKIIHKSDVGGVLLNIQDRHELSEAYNRLIGMLEKKIPSEEIVGVLVEKMMPPSTELIIGGLRDPQFGPSLMFGIGGIFTEVYNDVTFRVAPIDRKDAAEMIRELKGSKILEGIRGNPPADQEAIITILVNTSELLYEHEAINQLDLNPVMAYPKGVCAVDARIILKDTKEG